VAGAIDYLMFTKFIPRPGWLIPIIEFDRDLHGEYQKIQKDEIRDNYRASLGFINHPGRIYTL